MIFIESVSFLAPIESVFCFGSYCIRVLDDDVELFGTVYDLISREKDEHKLEVLDTQCNLTSIAIFLTLNINNKRMKGKALRKHSLLEKTAASVLLKLFISSNE